MKFSGLAAALALTVALAGCQDEPEPKFTDPSATPPSETTETPSATAEPNSPRAEERAFIREFLNEFESAMDTGDAKSFRAMTSPDCENCQVISGNIRDAYRDGGHVESKGFTITALKHQRTEAGRSVWTTDLESTKQTWFDGKGEVVNVIPAGIQLFTLILARAQGVLEVADFGHREP